VCVGKVARIHHILRKDNGEHTAAGPTESPREHGGGGHKYAKNGIFCLVFPNFAYYENDVVGME
jgi:hypothetical protein